MTDSEFVAHEPCNNCGSSDANSVYSDGHKFCFVCQTYTPAEGAVIHSQTMSTNDLLQGYAQELRKRRISVKTCEKFKIFTYEGVSTDTLFGQHLFPNSGKRIVITEGELDAASCYEAMSGWPMVSLPHGAARPLAIHP